MVFYFKARPEAGDYTIFMGLDKYENEELIKYGFPEDIWFHVDKMSSAHVYLRLHKGQTIDDISEGVLEDCAQLVKANSIQGNKVNNIDVVYTPWANLKKTASMDVGQVGFHNPKMVRTVKVEKRINEIVNRLNKTKVERKPDLKGVVALDPNFKKLSMEHIVSAYKRTTTRAILLDYDGTLMPQASIDKSPNSKTIDILNSLCRDKNNMVFLVSAKSRKTLAEWFSPCENLGIAAEHGYFFRLRRDEEWETCIPVADCGWKQIAEPVMKLYTETTDGSTIEDKETALVWSYEDADPDFGSCQAKELLDHLESVLANEPVTVKSGQNLVEVKPQGVNKGLVAKRLLSTMQEREMLPDFVLCVGDDRSDEDMFEVIISSMAGPSIAPRAEVFACTVGRKPSKAKYYLDDTVEIVRLMQGLACVADQMVPV